MSKIGFWPLFTIVIGGQVGSGIFMLPANLAPFGFYGVLGLIIAVFGAVSLAVTFASLSFYYPKTGGPHVYVKEAFGELAAFFTGWTYWVVSWASSTAVVIAVVGYIMPILGWSSKELYITLEIIILFCITLINLRGVSSAGHFEVILSVMKFTPLLLIPIISLLYFNFDNFILDKSFQDFSISAILSRVTLIALWGFIGLEAATTPANSVINPKQNIPLAVIFGTLFVATIYLINSLGIMGIIPGETLQHSSAAYVETVQCIFGGSWYVVISIVAFIVCLSSLNAWILTGGQIVLGLSEDGLMPKIFSKKNSHDSPYIGLLISGLGIIPLLFLTNEETFTNQISLVIDFSVIAFLFVYVISVLSFLQIQKRNKVFYDIKNFIAIFAFLFCLWIIFNTEVKILLIASICVFSGLPLYVFWYRKKNYRG